MDLEEVVRKPKCTENESTLRAGRPRMCCWAIAPTVDECLIVVAVNEETRDLERRVK